MTRIEEAEESKLEKTVADMQEMFKKHLPNMVFRREFQQKTAGISRDEEHKFRE